MAARNQAPLRTETAEELQSLAAEIRNAAAVLGALYAKAETLSRPVYLTGWTYPIGHMAGFVDELRDWATAVDAVADQPL